MLRRPELLALYKCCDCFVSLHRSEGFGRNIVECLMLGLDVIATGYSGNLDYSTASNMHLVDYSLCKVKKGEYFGAEGLQWAEPSVKKAAELMRKAVADKDIRPTKKEVYSAYMPSVICNTYKERLNYIYETYK